MVTDLGNDRKAVPLVLTACSRGRSVAPADDEVRLSGLCQYLLGV